MQEFITILIFCISIIIINIIYIYVFFNKDYKSTFIVQLEDLSRNLNYDVIKDDKTFFSKVIENKIILGTDVYLQLDISKLTELYFKVYFSKTITSTNTNNFLKNFILIISKLSLIISIVFYLGMFIFIFSDNEGFMMTSFVSIMILFFISLFVLLLLFLSFKKSISSSKENLIVVDTKLIQILYWYFPISILNSLLRPIDYTRWLFSKN
jgi:hypothetical protein